VHLHFQSFMGKGVMIQYVLPLGPMLQKVVHVFYTERSWLSPYAKLVLWGESILFERDVRVWNSKTYIDRPLAGREDALLLKHRRWFAQFYSKSSRSLGASAILDW
jgi:cholesterol 7-dehydrogenase